MEIRLDARHHFLKKNMVPEEWIPCEIGTLAEVVGGATPSREETIYWNNGKIPWATPTDLTSNNSKYISKTAEYISEAGLSECAAGLLPVGSILYTSRATIGAKAINQVPMATNQGFANFMPHNINGEYLFYLLDVLTPIIKRLGAGTTFDEVSKREIRKIWCAVPRQEDEQETIARILDAVDTIIERTKESEGRDRTVKKALAQHLFEKGLRGETIQKTQIGPIPCSWTVVPINAVVDLFQYGLSVAMGSKGQYPILRMGNIQSGEILLENMKYVNLPEKIAEIYLLKRSDVVFNRTNSQEHVGKVGIYRSDERVVFASYLIRLMTDKSKVNNYYLGQLLNTYTAQCRIKRYATPGVEQVNINAKNLGRVLIPLPPNKDGLKEQEEIATILEQTDESIRSYGRVLDALNQLKKSLMHDLLTGKVRVKNLDLNFKGDL
jgi:type I restriction enzyme S subunit